MSMSPKLSLLGAVRVRPALVAAGLAALLTAACSESTTGPSAEASKPSMALVSARVLKFTKSCAGTVCTFDASSSTGFTSFRWTFQSGAVVYGVQATQTLPANGTFYLQLRGSFAATATTASGSATITALVSCTNGVCR